LGIGDWAQSPIPNPQSPIPNPQKKIIVFKINIFFKLTKNIIIIFKKMVKFKKYFNNYFIYINI